MAIDCNGFILTIRIGPGTWPQLLVQPGSCANANWVHILGSGMNDCIIDPSGSWALGNRDPALSLVRFDGFALNNFGIGLYSGNRCEITFQNIDFREQASSGSQIHVGNGANVMAVGPYRISAGATRHVAVGNFGVFNYTGITIDIQNNPAFGQFAYVNSQGLYQRGSGTHTGEATGPRVLTLAGSQLSLNGAGVDSLPGSTTGTVHPTTIIS